MPLTKKASAEDFIRDFLNSKSDQFKGKTKEEIKKMALAAYYEKQSEVKESATNIKYTDPNFEKEWEEAQRYRELNKLGKAGWIKLAKLGFYTTYSKIKDNLGNVDLEFDNLDFDKKKRFKSAFSKGVIESPIVVKFSNDDYDLVAGNTRTSGLVKQGLDPKMWVVDLTKHKDMSSKNKLKESFTEALLERLSHLTEEGGKYSHINFKPPEGVANAAERGLEYRKKNKGKGGLSAKQASQQGIGSGVQRASDLKSRNNVSPETIKRMVSFFARHAKNKSVEAGKEPWQDKGKIAWELWGGDAGKSWAEKIKNQMDKADEKSKNEVEMRLSNIIKENFEVVESMTSPKHMFKMFKDAEVKAHFYHLQTSSYAEHKALGKFYENLQDITDSIMEISLSNLETKLNFQCEGGLHIDFTMGFEHCLSRFHTYVELCIASTQDEALKDALIQAERLVSKTKYLLTLR